MDKKEYYRAIDEAYADSAKAEPLLLRLIEQSREEYGEDSVFYASMLSELGGYYRSAGRLNESEKYFKETAQLINAALGENHPEYATALNNLAGTYRLLGRFAEAREMFKKSLGIYENSVGTEHVLYAAGFNNIALISLDESDYETAAMYLQKSSEVLKKNPNAMEEYATSLANLASLYIRIGRFNDAVANLITAKELYENELGIGTPHYYMILNSLGIARYKQGLFDEAVDFFTQAAAEAGKMFGEDNKEYKGILQHLALAKEGRDSK